MKAKVIILYSIFLHVKYNLLDIFTFWHVIFFSNIVILYLINISLAFYYFLYNKH